MGVDRRRMAVGLGLAGLLLVGVGALGASGIKVSVAQAASTPKTVAQCRKQFKHKKTARIACEKRVKHKKVTRPNPTSGCTLVNTWDGLGEDGDKQDFSVKLKETGTSPGPYSAQIEVAVHNTKVEICSGTVSWYEGNGASGQQTATVTIGVHGGVSSRVSLPVGADGVLAKVTARLK
jgi:hypothetical protein